MEQAKPILIAIGNKARVGKNAFAFRVADTHGCFQVSIAAGVYAITRKIQEHLGMPTEKDPKLLQLIGDGLRTIYSPDTWIDQTINTVQSILEEHPYVNIVITDMRYPNEMQKLKEFGFTTIRITRENRIIDRDPNHVSEIALDDAIFDYTIDNNGTMAEFHQQVDSVIKVLESRT